MRYTFLSVVIFLTRDRLLNLKFFISNSHTNFLKENLQNFTCKKFINIRSDKQRDEWRFQFT